jgi:hypothetical protein
MTVRTVAIVGLLAAAAMTLAPPASAQMPMMNRNYQTTPTMSPWLNLYRRDTGPLDNYHTFVRPQMELQQTLTRQDDVNQRQSDRIAGLSQRVTQMQDKPAGPRPTGSATGSGFMHFSHYYNSRFSAQAAGVRGAATFPGR